MKKSGKVCLVCLCALALAAGSSVATSAIVTKNLQAQYMGITLQVNGQTVTPTDGKGNPVEPFAVDGTIYVPIRTLGEVLGKPAQWDGEKRTVTIGQGPFVEDAAQLIGTIESAHPAFLLDAVPEGYAAAKAELLATAAEPACTTYDFAWAAMGYTASLEDGHTAINVFGNGAQPMLDLVWVADGEHLYLTDAGGKLTKTEVTAVGGLSIADLFDAIDRFIPSENQAAQDKNHTAWARHMSFLNHAGAQLSGDYQNTEVSLSDGTKRTVAFVTPQAAGERERAISAKSMGDVFYVDMNQCVADEQNTAVAQQLAQAVKNGTKKVIIDVRGNGGGNSAACEELLEAMGMEAPAYGGVVRYSALAQAQRGYEKAEGSEEQGPDLTTAKQNHGVKLVVLTDERTFSSATMLAVMVRDGKLGTVIGRTSSNAPSGYGDILSYQLGNTGLMGYVSHIRWLRPDPAAAHDAVTPDVITTLGTDALDEALKFLK